MRQSSWCSIIRVVLRYSSRKRQRSNLPTFCQGPRAVPRNRVIYDAPSHTAQQGQQTTTLAASKTPHRRIRIISISMWILKIWKYRPSSLELRHKRKTSCKSLTRTTRSSQTCKKLSIVHWMPRLWLRWSTTLAITLRKLSRVSKNEIPIWFNSSHQRGSLKSLFWKAYWGLYRFIRRMTFLLDVFSHAYRDIFFSIL